MATDADPASDGAMRTSTAAERDINGGGSSDIRHSSQIYILYI